VQLASALVHEPDILVLDEPFSGLDPVAVDVMSEVLRSQADRGVPVIFSSHQLELVERLSDRVGIVSRGTMVASGKIDDLRATSTSRWSLALTGAAAPPGAPPGVTITESGQGRWIVEATSADAAQALLASAVQQGTVTEFSPLRPTLTDLFRDVVRAPQEVA
jgi:ABC-2 type transport system ATP-binding protein